MPRAAPIGRERSLEQLLAAATEAATGRGSLILLAGPTGGGKKVLLKTLVEALESTDTGPQLDALSVRCYPTSAVNPLGPFGEVLRAVTNRERRGGGAKHALELIRAVAPDLVELIPLIGKLASFGVKAAADLGVYALGGDREAQQAERASDVALALQSITTEIPLAIVVSEAHWLDGPSTEVIARLTDGIDERCLLLIVAYDPGLVDDRHPLARLRSVVLGHGGVHRIELANFGLEDVAAVLRDRYGETPGERLAEWLLDRTDGSPLFLREYLAYLEERGVLHETDRGWTLDGTIEGGPGEWQVSGRLAQTTTPDTLLELVRPRVADLDDEERALLERAAVQGRRFLSAVIVKLLDLEEDEILDRLARIEERRHMISTEEIEDWWSDRSTLYTFDPGVFQELLYGRYARKTYERRRRHLDVARALEALIADDDPPPRHALLEIARHYEEGGDPLTAGRCLVQVADSTFAEGADRETATSAERAALLLRNALKGSLSDEARLAAQRLLARAIVLHLLGGEPNWRTGQAVAGERLIALAEEAERVADSAGDAALRASACFAKARVLQGYRGLDAAIAGYKAALQLARQAHDAVTEFTILTNLGHHLASVNLEQGWEVLHQANALLKEDTLTERLPDDVLTFEKALLEARIGVAAFDLGHYGQALKLLVQSSQVLRQARRRTEAAWAMSFLGQLYTAIGLYEAAEATFGEAITDERASLGARSYLRALLGHLYIEWSPPRLLPARDELERARLEGATSNFTSVSGLVDSYWAELLLAEGDPNGLREAEAALEAAPTFGWVRGEITSYSLRARIALAEGRCADAVRLSAHAVELLTERGGCVPAVRSEEIHFVHARVLAAAHSGESGTHFAKAAQIVQDKADSLDDPSQRESFLRRVRLSRDVLEGG